MSKLTHHQECEWRFNHKHKSSRCKIPSNHFTIVMDKYNSNCNSNNNNNHNSNHKNNDNNEQYHDKSPEPQPICCERPHKHHHCIPRRGELVINGGFENPQDPFFGWIIRSGVEEIDPDIGDIAHQGFNAARLGYKNPHAILYQNVPGICPGLFFQLNFFMSAATECGNARVNVRMEFLDHHKDLLDFPALQILIPEDSLNSKVFTGFNNITHIPAPAGARFARISFELNTHDHPDRYVHLDDVSLVAIGIPVDNVIESLKEES